MKVLLDTCVISELHRPNADLRVRRRVAALDPDTSFLSVITFGELVKGVTLLPKGRRKHDLESWLLGLERQFESRILPVDLETARIWGESTARAQKLGIQVPANDGLIAATGIRHGLHVMTRNTQEFANTGAFIVDPWQQ